MCFFLRLLFGSCERFVGRWHVRHAAVWHRYLLLFILYEDDPIHFLMCKIWWHQNKLFHISIECNVSIVITPSHTHNLQLLSAKLVLDDKNVWLTAFPTVQKRGESFVQWCITIIVRGSLTSNASKIYETVWGPFSSRYTFDKWHEEFQLGWTKFKDRDRCGLPETVANIPNKTWPRWSVWSKKTDKLQTVT